MSRIESETIDDLIEEFDELDDQERGELLIDLARDLPDLNAVHKAEANLVPGCQSQVWLVPEISEDDPPAIGILADSDSQIVRGLIYILLRIYSGRTPDEILQTDSGSVFERLGLKRYISATRRNGLHSMVKRIRLIAESLGGDSGAASVAEPNVRLSAADEILQDVFEPLDAAAAKRDFPILNRPLPQGGPVVYLDSASSAQKPTCVIEAEREVQENFYANAFRGRYYFGSRVDDEIEGTREKLRHLIGAESANEIVFT